MFRTAAVSVVARGCKILTLLISIPMVLHGLGPERFGVWMVATALATFFTIADGGVTTGIVSPVASAYGVQDFERIRLLVASAIATTLVLTLALLTAVIFAIPLVDWMWAFNISDRAIAHEAEKTIAILCACYALSFPATVIRQARLGMLQGAAVNGWDLLGSLLAVSGLVVAIWLGAAMPIVALAWAGGPVLMRWVAATVFLIGKGRPLLPKLQHARLDVSKSLLVGGGLFVLMGAMQTLVAQSDQLLIARILGAAHVTEYAVLQRLFNQPQILVFLVLAAQWPAYAEALSQGATPWVRTTLRRTLIGATLFAVLVAGALAILIQPILAVWIGDKVAPSASLVISMAVYSVVLTVGSVFTYFYFALGLFGRLISFYTAMIAINIPLAIVLIPRLGPEGAAIATTVGYLVALIGPSLFTIRSVLHRLPQLREKALMETPLPPAPRDPT